MRIETTQRTENSRPNDASGIAHKASVLILLSCLLPITPSFATEGEVLRLAQSETKLQFNIPATDLSAALDLIAKQADVELVFRPAQLKGLKTKGVSGTLSSREAIEKLLEGTPLKLSVDQNTGAMMIGHAKPRATARSSLTLEESEGGDEGMTLAQNTGNMQTASLQDERSAAQTGSGTSESGAGADGAATPEILVIGSRSLNTDIRRSRDDIQPYVIFEREAIEQSGLTNIEEFIRQRLPSANISGTASQVATSDGSTSGITLRGLGTEQTLILVDGHRVAGFGSFGTAHQPDLNGIPMAAVERIEVLPTTASGIYGGGATGGVINVVLRREFSGVETKLAYGNTYRHDSASRRVDLAAAFNLEGGRTNVLIAGSYSEDEGLLNGDRDFTRRSRALLLRNNPASINAGFYPPLGSTTNICAGTFFCDGTPLTLDDSTPLNASIAYIPAGYAGRVEDGDAALLATAGRYNLDLPPLASSGGKRQNLLTAPTVESGMLTVRREFSSRVQGYLQGYASNNDSVFNYNTVFQSPFLIPANAPNNPFAQDIQALVPLSGGDGDLTTSLHDRKVLGGVIVRLPHKWSATADYTWNRTRYFNSTAGALGYDSTTFQPAAAVPIADGSLDVLRDINLYPVDFSPYMASPQVVEPVYTTLRNLALRFSGPVWSVPAGEITMSTLIERREEIFDEFRQSANSYIDLSEDTIVVYSARKQSVESAYLEANLPLVSSVNRIPGIHQLELQVGGRRDEYTTHTGNAYLLGSGDPLVRVTNKLGSTNPTFGLRLQPIQDVTLRASYGTGFLPPSLTELVPSPDQFLSPFTPLTDPRRGDEVLPLTVVLGSGGNPDLRPEKSKSWAVGAVLTPRFLPGLRLSVDWNRIEKTDNVSFFSFQQSDLELEPYVPGMVVRDEPAPGDPYGVGPITRINFGAYNMANQQFEGYDINIQYRWPTERYGSFTFNSDATRTVRSDAQITPLAPVLSDLDFNNSLKWKGNASLTWEHAPWTLSWTMLYYHSYSVGFPGFPIDSYMVDQGAPRIPHQTYHDLFGSYRFQAPAGRWLNGTELQLTVRNVFNTSPPILATSGYGYPYSTWADPRLGSYLLSVKKAF